MGANFQKNHCWGYGNDSWIKFNKGGMGKRICRKVKYEYERSTVNKNDFERMEEVN